MPLRHENARSKPGQTAAPGRRQLLTSAAGIVIGAGAVAAGAVAGPAAAVAAATGIATVATSGDATGATDAAAINGALSAGQAVQLVPGTYYVNATIEVPAHGVLRGAGRDALGSPYVTTIQAVGSLPAVIASKGWLENTNTGLNGTELSDFTVNGNNTATEGIVLQTFDGRAHNLGVMNMLDNGIALYTLSRSGTVSVSGNLSNNRITSCVVNNCGGRGIGTIESATSDTYTDGYCQDNIVANCDIGIGIDQAADWLIMGNHVYIIKTHGILAGDMWNSKIIGNEIDEWGQSATAGVYRGIDGYTMPSYGGMNIIMGNVIDVQVAPGNASSGLEGMNLACHANSTATWTVIGNNLLCEPKATSFTHADPFVVTNRASTCVTNLASTGNQARGNWSTSSWVSVPDGGTISHTSGI